jgi:hypothetical protein
MCLELLKTDNLGFSGVPWILPLILLRLACRVLFLSSILPTL